MKGSLCGAGRPLAKDKTAVCPPSLARAWGLPRAGRRVGVGTGALPGAFLRLPCLLRHRAALGLGPSQACPPPTASSPLSGEPESPASLAVGREVVSSLALEACKQVQQ